VRKIYSQWLAEQSTDERVLDDHGVEPDNPNMEFANSAPFSEDPKKKTSNESMRQKKLFIDYIFSCHA
jgi:hypothetical protein